MNLLIVDDELNSILTVKKMINQEKLMINQIYCAENALAAKEYLLNGQIDIVLCDIEMPKENGLELLEWIGRNELPVEFIIMTCYAEFEYAKKAVGLGSIAYLLKPVDQEELDKELQNAIQLRNHKQQMSQFRHSWIRNQDTMREKFWMLLFRGEIMPDKSNIQHWLQAEAVAINIEINYCPILFVIRKWGGNVKKEDYNLFRFALKNILTELFIGENNPFMRDIIQIGGDTQLVIVSTEFSSAEEIEKYHIICNQFLSIVKNYFAIEINCYIGKDVSLWDAANEIESLYQMDYNNLRNTGVYDSRDYIKMFMEKKFKADWKEFENWLTQLIDGEYHSVSKSINDYLEYHIKSNKVNRTWLISFQRQYMIMLGAYAAIKKIYLNQIINNETEEIINSDAENGIEELRKLVNYTLNAIYELERSKCKNNDPVERTKEYIEAHIADELDMDTLAQNVHLNPDYLTRIFRKATGDPVNKYIVNQRMKKAKQLLKYTNQPISEIAFQIGYYNYISFNRIFTKSIGVSPQSYRIKNRDN